jgi:hypothetical protein
MFVVGGVGGSSNAGTERFEEAPVDPSTVIMVEDDRYPSTDFSVMGTDLVGLQKQILESQDLVTRPQMLVGTILPFQQLDGVLIKDGKVQPQIIRSQGMLLIPLVGGQLSYESLEVAPDFRSRMLVKPGQAYEVPNYVGSVMKQSTSL